MAGVCSALVRRATAADVPRIVEMGRRHHAVVREVVPLVEEDFAEHVANVIKGGAAWVSPEGSLGAVIFPEAHNAGHLVAVETWWHAFDGHGAELLSAFHQWAWDMGAKSCMITTIHGHKPEAMARMMAGRGWRQTHTVFRREVN